MTGYNRVVLPDRPTFISNQTSSEERIDEMLNKPCVQLGDTKINASGLILLSARETVKYFMFLDKMIFRVNTNVSIRVPRGFVANIVPIDYTYSNRFVLSKTFNITNITEYHRVVVDLLIFRDPSEMEVVIEKTVPLAGLYFTKIELIE